jgi:hypothetical protein
METIEVEVSNLKMAVGILKEFVSEIPAVLEDSKLKMCGMDTSGAALCQIHLDCKVLEYDRNDHKFIIPLNKLVDVLKGVPSGTAKITFGSIMTVKCGKIAVSVPLYDISTTKRIPKGFPNATAIYPSTNKIVITNKEVLTFIKNIRLEDTLSLHISFDEGHIVIEGGDKVEHYEYILEKGDDYVMITEAEDSALYPLDMVKLAAGKLTSFEAVLTEFAYGFPLCMVSSIKDEMAVSIFIAPRIEND